ncbi:hypothetical protein [Aeromicrobium sp. Root472D3]|uniref:hypothetical protein n=1 Tax=Aeromicrobium sp. Root472D3 TaxID=1736540 RepID=UPI0006F4B8DF|nr:hypothetical protein [Aeromicrobium sp. Root472D3]KQX74311.1 hypothetical protein ASD10_03430 [Aeromicrobium sp. Root472D3]
MTTVPSVRFALPGRWVKAELDDPEAVSTLRGLLPDDHPGGEAWLESLRAAGASTLLLRVQSRSAAAIAFIWPPRESSGDPSLEGLRARLGVEGQSIAHERGYATLRDRRTGAGASQDVVTYGVSHPDTGRILVVRCMAFDHTFEPIELEDFDLAAGDLTWDET